MKTFSDLKKNLKQNFSNLKRIKIAILGDTATQFLAQSIQAVGYEKSLFLDIWEADFNQIERQILDTSSELYTFEPEIVIVFQSTHKLLQKYNKQSSNEQKQLASSRLMEIKNLYNSLEQKLQAKFIYYNYPEINDSVFGNYANKNQASFLFQLRQLNYELMNWASKTPNFYLCDLSAIQNKIGRERLFQASIYINTDMVLSLEALPWVAYMTVDLINALNGQFKKCLILDLDNTLWGGVIGDDGIENIEIGSLGIGKAFSEFQHWIKKLKNRGIIIAVCSKNTESVAKEPFEKHPDMVLRLDDIAVFKANWENKVDNIIQIQKVLNIGLDSMVFLDDNPFERNMVRDNIPEICVPELPEDPAEYLEYLYALNLFETVSSSEEDKDRTRLYQVEAERLKSFQQFAKEDDFLKNLEMKSEVQGFNAFNIPRVAQLTQRSNQFNLRTVRYTEADIKAVVDSNRKVGFAFTLKDKFGDNGLISVIILNKENDNTLFIDTWLMSCRVLKRGMERFVLNTLVDYAKNHNYSILKGEYIPTSKNEMVKSHYLDLDFVKQGKYFTLELQNYQEKETYIQQIK